MVRSKLRIGHDLLWACNTLSILMPLFLFVLTCKTLTPLHGPNSRRVSQYHDEFWFLSKSISKTRNRQVRNDITLVTEWPIFRAESHYLNEIIRTGLAADFQFWAVKQSYKGYSKKCLTPCYSHSSYFNTYKSKGLAVSINSSTKL